jgi:hypothetical protein
VDEVPAEWVFSDAWVFAAIQGHSIEDGDPLTEVIATGDAINHAILTEEEFTRAVPRLINAGLIGADLTADRYWRTQAGHELFERRMKRHGLFGWIEAIPPALRRLGPPQDGEWVLPPGSFDRAARAWVRRGNAIARELMGRSRRPTTRK